MISDAESRRERKRKEIKARDKDKGKDCRRVRGDDEFTKEECKGETMCGDNFSDT